MCRVATTLAGDSTPATTALLAAERASITLKSAVRAAGAGYGSAGGSGFQGGNGVIQGGGAAFNGNSGGFQGNFNGSMAAMVPTKVMKLSSMDHLIFKETMVPLVLAECKEEMVFSLMWGLVLTMVEVVRIKVSMGAVVFSTSDRIMDGVVAVSIIREAAAMVL